MAKKRRECVSEPTGVVVMPASEPALNDELEGPADWGLILDKYFRGNAATDELRQTVAIALADSFIRPHLTAPETIRALDAAQGYQRGVVERKEFLNARRTASRAHDPHGFVQALTFSLLTPMTSSYFSTFVHVLIRVLMKKAIEFKKVDDVELRLDPKDGRRIAEVLLSHLPPEVQLQWGHVQPLRFRFRDARFAAKQYESQLLLLEQRKVPRAAYEAMRIVLQAFQGCHGADPIAAANVNPIVAALASDVVHIRKMAIYFLIGLAPYSESARQGLLAGLEHRSSQVRFHVVSMVAFYRRPYDRSFTLKFFERALRDRSSKVRRFASQGCRGVECRELLPVLIEVAENETNSSVKKAIEQDIALLRDGYFVGSNEADPDEVFVDIKTTDGGWIHVLSRQKFDAMTKSEVSTLVDRIREINFGDLDVEALADSILAARSGEPKRNAHA